METAGQMSPHTETHRRGLDLHLRLEVMVPSSLKELQFTFSEKNQLLKYWQNVLFFKVCFNPGWCWSLSVTLILSALTNPAASSYGCMHVITQNRWSAACSQYGPCGGGEPKITSESKQ